MNTEDIEAEQIDHTSQTLSALKVDQVRAIAKGFGIKLKEGGNYLKKATLIETILEAQLLPDTATITPLHPEQDEDIEVDEGRIDITQIRYKDGKTTLSGTLFDGTYKTSLPIGETDIPAPSTFTRAMNALQRDCAIWEEVSMDMVHRITPFQIDLVWKSGSYQVSAIHFMREKEGHPTPSKMQVGVLYPATFSSAPPRQTMSTDMTGRMNRLIQEARLFARNLIAQVNQQFELFIKAA